MSLLFQAIQATEERAAAKEEAKVVRPTAQATKAPEAPRKPAYDRDSLFTVDSHDIYSDFGVIPGKKGLFVDGQNINIVSDKYEIHQPTEIMDTFDDVAEKTNLSIDKVLTNKTNGGLMVFSKYGNTQIGGESHDIRLTFHTSHDSKYRTFLSFDVLRMACFNQVPLLMRNKKRFIFSEKHYCNALDLKTIEQAVSMVPQMVRDYDEKVLKMLETSFSYNDFIEFYINHYKVNTGAKQFQTKINRVKDIYHSAPGQRELSDSSYKAFNAITYMNTHEGRNTALKEENAVIKGGNDSIEVLHELVPAYA